MQSSSWVPLRCKFTNERREGVKVTLWTREIQKIAPPDYPNPWFSSLEVWWHLNASPYSEGRSNEGKIGPNSSLWDERTIKGSALMKDGSRWAPQCWTALPVALMRTFQSLRPFQLCGPFWTFAKNPLTKLLFWCWLHGKVDLIKGARSKEEIPRTSSDHASSA